MWLISEKLNLELTIGQTGLYNIWTSFALFFILVTQNDYI
jgi:hypothetical protein